MELQLRLFSPDKNVQEEYLFNFNTLNYVFFIQRQDKLFSFKFNKNIYSTFCKFPDIGKFPFNKIDTSLAPCHSVKSTLLIEQDDLSLVDFTSAVQYLKNFKYHFTFIPQSRAH